MGGECILTDRIPEIQFFEKKVKHNEIYIIGDIHADGEMFRKKEFEKAIEIMGNAPKIVLGDIVDYAFFNDLLSQYRKLSNVEDPELYIASMIDYVFSKLKNVILLCEGNHDIRAAKLTGENFLHYMCKKRKIPYVKGQGVIRISNKKESISILCTHGSGGGKRESAVLNKLIDIARNSTGLDLIAIGHFHNFVHSEITKTNFSTFPPRTEITEVISVPSFLGYELYAQKKCYPPPVSGIVKVTISNPLNIEYIRI